MYYLLAKSSVVCFTMAELGPLLLVVAGPLAFKISRQAGLRSVVGITTWAFVFLALIAAGAFYEKIISVAPLP
jgi:hypothetical protein